MREAFKEIANVPKSVNDTRSKTASASGEILEDTQDSADKTQPAPKNIGTRESFSPKGLLLESVPVLISPLERNRKSYVSPNKNNEMKSMQLTLYVMPERTKSTRLKPRKKTSGVLRSIGNKYQSNVKIRCDLLQFL